MSLLSVTVSLVSDNQQLSPAYHLPRGLSYKASTFTNILSGLSVVKPTITLPAAPTLLTNLLREYLAMASNSHQWRANTVSYLSTS